MPVSPEALARAGQVREQALDDLRHAVDLGTIRNADLESLKFSIGRAWDDERSGLPDLLGRPAHPHTPLDRIWYEIVQLPPYSLHHVKVIPKRLPAILKKVEEPDARITAAAEAITILHDRWLPVARLLEDVKPLIVKGRKPSDAPADPRTLENTGTCSCCERNIKLRDLKIVDHGFQVADGRHGQCFGVGHYPIEISTHGVEAMVNSLESQVEKTEAHLKRLENDEVNTFYLDSFRKPEKVGRDHPKFARVRAARIEQTKSEISSMKSQIKFCEAKIAAWAPRPLPDGAGHFALDHDGQTPGSRKP